MRRAHRLSACAERTLRLLRMERVEARYLAQFSALDTIMSQLQTTGNYLSQQLAALSSS